MPYIITKVRPATHIRDMYNSNTQGVQSEAEQKPGLMRLQRVHYANLKFALYRNLRQI